MRWGEPGVTATCPCFGSAVDSREGSGSISRFFEEEELWKPTWTEGSQLLLWDLRAGRGDLRVEAVQEGRLRLRGG